jgi:thermitase
MRSWRSIQKSFTWLWLGLTISSLPALEVRMAADTLSIQADKTPLSEILSQLQDAGVRVAMDDRINPLITAHFTDREIGEGIKRLLADCDYALSWQTLDGPAGKLKRLSEVLVYKPGDRRQLIPHPTPSATVAQTNSILCLKNEILIRLRADITGEQFRALLMKNRAMVLDGIPALGIYRLLLPPGANLAETLNSLTKDPLVLKTEPNQIYRSITPINTGEEGLKNSPRTVSALEGPSIAILDSGFTPNTLLANAVVTTLDATNPQQAISDPLGHGTQMAFIAAGAVNPTGLDSLSPASVPIIPIRTMDDQGMTSGFSLMQSMVFSVEHGAKVISMSWGSDTDSGFFNDAVAYAQKQGVILVAAAGNEPTGKPFYPAALPDVIAVATLTPDGNIWNQSNYGSFIKFAAPGFATLPVGYKGPPGQYAGSSIAAAYTANVIAQYLASHPKADGPEAIRALTQTLQSTPPAADTIHPEIPRFNAAAIRLYLK